MSIVIFYNDSKIFEFCRKCQTGMNNVNEKGTDRKHSDYNKFRDCLENIHCFCNKLIKIVGEQKI